MEDIDINIESLPDTKKKLYCLNCGKRGHMSKRCKDPPTSYGVICFKILDDWKIYQNILEMKYHKTVSPTLINNINLYWFNNKNKDIRDTMDEYITKLKQNIKFLLIRRKHSLGYIEYIRGRYDTNNLKLIIHLLKQMTDEERNFIINNDFNLIWEDLWRNNSHNKLYEKEYIKSMEKFEYIKDNHLDLLEDTGSKFAIPEWGFPKGRRNYLEKDIDCAKREFIEESTLKNNEFMVLDRIYPLTESFFGTNQIKYKHIYYLGTSDINRKLEIKNHPDQIQEVGDIGWFTYDEVMDMLRPYHVERKKIVEELLYFLAFNIKFYQENDTAKILKIYK